jgi:broad specificity polyphosphatase/5'/3'-nucleotidase SurE
MPSIAVSYGVVQRPVAQSTFDLAHDAAVDVCKRLFDDWGYEDHSKRPVQVYSINIPLVEEALTPEKRKVCFTRMWRNTYGQLFKPTAKQIGGDWKPADVPTGQTPASNGSEQDDGIQRFEFTPHLHPILFPDPETVPEGTDAWAFYHGHVSVTPIRAEYAGLEETGSGFGSGHPDGTFW